MGCGPQAARRRIPHEDHARAGGPPGAPARHHGGADPRGRQHHQEGPRDLQQISDSRPPDGLLSFYEDQ